MENRWNGMGNFIINIVQFLFLASVVICNLIFYSCIEIIKYNYFVKTKAWEKFTISRKLKKRIILSFAGAIFGVGIAWYLEKLL